MAILMVVVVNTVVKGVVLHVAVRVYVVASNAVVRRKGVLRKDARMKVAVARGVRRKVRVCTMAAVQCVATRRAVSRGVVIRPVVVTLAVLRKDVRLRPVAALPIVPEPGKRGMALAALGSLALVARRAGSRGGRA